MVCPVLENVYTKNQFMLKEDRPVKRYSESFKLKVLSEIERGEKSKTQVIQDYQLGFGTLYNWIKKYSKFDLLNKRVRIETMEEKDRIKSLQQQIDQLKDALVDKDLKLLVNESYLEVLSEQLGYKDVEELKKKLKDRPSRK